MGLDMYLYARREVANPAELIGIIGPIAAEPEYEDDPYTYLGRWDFLADSEKLKAEAAIVCAGLTPLLGDESNSVFVRQDADGVTTVDVTAMYWRKANGIHGWFVTNCQDGIDECQLSEVSAEQLAELAATCRKAIACYNRGDNHGVLAILEPQHGFFFGGTEIDEWWARDTLRTADEIESLLERADALGGVTFFYRSSW